MGLKESLERMRVLFDGTSLDSRLPPAYPGTALEIDPDRITGARIQFERKTGRPVIRRAAFRALPEGAIDAALGRANIVDPAAVGRALDEVLRDLGPGEHKVSLLLPDHVARVSLLAFPSMPATRRELLELVRFRMSKSLPFKSEDAALDIMPLGAPPAGSGPAAGSVLAVFMSRAVLDQYESLLAARGYWPGLVGLSTLELFNLFRKRLATGPNEGDLLLLNLTRRYLSLLILSRGEIIFYRCKPHPAGFGGEDSLAGLRREIYTSLAFYQEKLLGRGLGRACLRTAGVPAEPAAEAVRAEAGCPVDILHLHDVAQPDKSAHNDEEASSYLAPVAGAVAGRRR